MKNISFHFDILAQEYLTITRVVEDSTIRQKEKMYICVFEIDSSCFEFMFHL